MTNPPLTWLYVPGDRPDRFERAFGSGADVVILDLEDAVHPDHKAAARDAVVSLLAKAPAGPCEVRINSLGSPWGAADLSALGSLPGLQGVRIPKVAAPADVARVASVLPAGRPIALIPLIESALGVEAAFAIATAHTAITSIGLGEADLSSDLWVGDEGLGYARGRVVNAARAAGLPPPAMSVYATLNDLDGLAASCRAGRALGFLGRAAIHPEHLSTIAAAFTPTADEVRAAHSLLRQLNAGRAAGLGGLTLEDGRFVDSAMVALAEQTIRLSNRGSPLGST